MHVFWKSIGGRWRTAPLCLAYLRPNRFASQPPPHRPTAQPPQNTVYYILAALIHVLLVALTVKWVGWWLVSPHVAVILFMHVCDFLMSSNFEKGTGLTVKWFCLKLLYSLFVHVCIFHLLIVSES